MIEKQKYIDLFRCAVNDDAAGIEQISGDIILNKINALVTQRKLHVAENIIGGDKPKVDDSEDDFPDELDFEDDDSEDDEKYAMLRADLNDRHEGGYERRNIKKEVRDGKYLLSL